MKTFNIFKTDGIASLIKAYEDAKTNRDFVLSDKYRAILLEIDTTGGLANNISLNSMHQSFNSSKYERMLLLYETVITGEIPHPFKRGDKGHLVSFEECIAEMLQGFF